MREADFYGICGLVELLEKQRLVLSPGLPSHSLISATRSPRRSSSRWSTAGPKTETAVSTSPSPQWTRSTTSKAPQPALCTVLRRLFGVGHARAERVLGRLPRSRSAYLPRYPQSRRERGHRAGLPGRQRKRERVYICPLRLKVATEYTLAKCLLKGLITCVHRLLFAWFHKANKVLSFSKNTDFLRISVLPSTVRVVASMGSH